MKLQEYILALEPYIVENQVLDINLEIAGAACDSRQVGRGWLFCAIKGAAADGAKFIPAAIKSGVVAIVGERPLSELNLPAAISYIQIKDGYHALARIAQVAYGFPAAKMNLYGITGTNGKTTSAYLLRKVLTDYFRGSGLPRKVGMIGTVVYDDGEHEIQADRTTPTPFDLQKLLADMVRNGVTDCVMEVSSHAIDQERLGDAKFSGAIFTNLTQDHLDYHGTMEAYFQCKSRLFAEMLKSDAVTAVNAGNEYGRRLLMSNPALTGFDAYQSLELVDLPIAMAGAYNRENGAGVAALAIRLGIPKAIVWKSVGEFTGAPGRLQPVSLPNGAIAYVDYAHTDDAIAKAISALRPQCRGRLAIVFGCGGDRDKTKRPKMAQAASMADAIYVTSDNPRTENPEAIIRDIIPGFLDGVKYNVIVDRRAAILQAVAEAAPEDIILVAGKGHEDYQEINGVKHHFSDAEVLAGL